MSDWHIEIDLLKRIERGSAPWLYHHDRYWRSEADFLAGEPHVVCNDQKAGDLLRWIGVDRTEKRMRFDGDDPDGEFYCEGSGRRYGNFDHLEHWVSGKEKYAVDRNGIYRAHFPKRFVVGIYTQFDVADWVREQAEDWIAAHPGATGHHCDPGLKVEDVDGFTALPEPIRALRGRWDATVTDGVSKRLTRLNARDGRGIGHDVTGRLVLQ